MTHRAHITTAALALYQTPPTGPADGPFTTPLEHLSRIQLHTGLAYLQVAVEIDITISHAAVAAGYGWDWSTFSFNWSPQVYTLDRLLGTHGLGYIPICVPVSGGAVLDPGLPVQVNAYGGARYLDFYLTTTQVRARERVDSGTNALPALSQTYKLFVLREPAEVPGVPATIVEANRARSGHGLFDSDFHYLRAPAASESPYYAGASQQIDTAGGICRYVDATGAIAHDFYQPSDYTGSLSSVSARQVQR